MLDFKKKKKPADTAHFENRIMVSRLKFCHLSLMNNPVNMSPVGSVHTKTSPKAPLMSVGSVERFLHTKRNLTLTDLMNSTWVYW